MTNLRTEVYLYTSALKKLPLKVEIFSNFWYHFPGCYYTSIISILAYFHGQFRTFDTERIFTVSLALLRDITFLVLILS